MTRRKISVIIYCICFALMAVYLTTMLNTPETFYRILCEWKYSVFLPLGCFALAFIGFLLWD